MLTKETQRLGLNGRVTGSYLTSMHSMDDYYVSKLMALMQEANLYVVRQGKVIAQSSPVQSCLMLDGDKHHIDWMQ